MCYNKYAERFYLIRYIHFWSPKKKEEKSEWYLNCSEVLREENMDLLPTQQTTHSLLTWCFWSTVCLFLFEMVDSYSGVYFQYKMALFKIHIIGLICAQHDYISPFIMVYGCLLSIQHNNQEMQGSVNALSLSVVSLQRPHRTTTVIFVLSWISSFLENTTRRL